MPSHKPRFVKRNRGRLLVSALLLMVLSWQWGSAFGIELKAQLAQVLIERAWQQKLAAPELPAAPWPWADTQPVARLQWLDAQGRVLKDLYVLSGGHGQALAFGPGLVDGSQMQGARVVGGHRDTHFEFLRNTERGDRLRWQDTNGRWRTYRITRQSIADASRNSLWVEPAQDSLWLVTCYPFDAVVPRGSLRYVVRADRVELPLQPSGRYQASI